MTSILSTEPWTQDPAVVNIPWRLTVEDFTLARAGRLGQANEKQPLKLGIFWTDGAVQPQPPITRGLHVVAREVEKAGHKACSQKLVPLCVSVNLYFLDCQLGASFAKYSQTSSCEFGRQKSNGFTKIIS